MKIVRSEYGHTALADNGRAVAHSHDLKLLQAYLADSEPAPDAPTEPSTRPHTKHTIRFWAYDPERVRRMSAMRSSDYTWDATCSCGWDSSTNGSAMSAIDDLVREHKR